MSEQKIEEKVDIRAEFNPETETITISEGENTLPHTEGMEQLKKDLINLISEHLPGIVLGGAIGITTGFGISMYVKRTKK